MSSDRRPVIGVSYMGNPHSLGILLTNSLMEGCLTRAGADTVLFDITDSASQVEEMVSKVDGVIMPGGDDINPQLYGEEAIPKTDKPDTARDIYDRLIIDAVIKQQKPFLGICRGHQYVNVYFGGTLWQDIAQQYPNYDPGQIWNFGLMERAVHSVDILGGPLKEALGKTSTRVNSLHHQAVKDHPDNLMIGAVAPDGIVEGFYLPSHPLFFTTQWHPEFMTTWDDDSCALFKYFVKKCDELR